MIDLLCEYRADPNTGVGPALLHAEFEAMKALLRKSARMDLPVAAAQFGHAEIVRALLDAGEDPSRYNPTGSHSHSTPLHQAAFAGHSNVVLLLIECGARLDLKDTMWQGTPEGWATHGGQIKIAEYLRTRSLQPPQA